MYDLGILGGMGSFATEDLYRRILKSTKASCDQDYPDIVILNKASIPDRSSYLLGESTENPLGALTEGIRDLNALQVGRIAVPCNTAHAFYREMQEASEAPVINMVESVLHYISIKKPQAKVCVLGTLGTIRTGVYERCSRFGLQILYPDEAVCRKIHTLIYDIKAGTQDEWGEFSDRLEKILGEITGTGDDLIFVAACTELSVLNPAAFPDYEVVDALDLLAQVSVLAAGKPLQASAALDEEILRRII